MDEETKEWLARFQKDIVHQFHIVAEDVMDRVKIVAEGVACLTEKLDRRTDELNNKIDNVQATLEGKYNQLDKKIDNVQATLEGKYNQLDKKIDQRYDQLDKKIDKVQATLDQKMDRTNQEVKELRADVLRIENGLVEKVEVVAARLDEHERVIHHL
jgi:ABC-type transporter Mla subunit MlaD